MNPDTDFLLPGRTCDCDVDYRCTNHDDAAEAAYWLARFIAAPSAVVVEVTA